jgi:hypothetical protein
MTFFLFFLIKLFKILKIQFSWIFKKTLKKKIIKEKNYFLLKKIYILSFNLIKNQKISIFRSKKINYFAKIIFFFFQRKF